MKKKRYTVTNILFNEISSDLFQTKGTLEYYLQDELGDKRKVITIAELGHGKKIKTVRALYQREKPLVDALANIEIGQTLHIDFAQFSKQEPASLLVRAKKKSVNRIYANNSVYIHNINTIIPDASRIPLLMTLVILGTLVVFSFGLFL